MPLLGNVFSGTNLDPDTVLSLIEDGPGSMLSFDAFFMLTDISHTFTMDMPGEATWGPVRGAEDGSCPVSVPEFGTPVLDLDPETGDWVPVPQPDMNFPWLQEYDPDCPPIWV